MIHFHQKRVVVVVEHLVGGLGAKAERHADAVEQREIVEHDLGKPVRLLANLTLVITKEERPVSRDRTAQGSAELVLLERIFTRTVENRPRRKRVVHPELVQRSGSLIGAGLGDDVDEAAERAAVLGKISGVENAEFL